MFKRKAYDAIIIGAGAAGLFCAGRIAQNGGHVLIIDHAKKPAEKVRISGGGRCNFTNIHTKPKNFLSENPHFAKSALARYTPQDFLDLLARHKIDWHEKTLGQLFCDERSGAIITMLLDELNTGELVLETSVNNVQKSETGFIVETSTGIVTCRSLIIASGGLSIPKMGASSFAFDLAKQFDHTVIEPRPALVPFTFSSPLKEQFAEIAGVAVDVCASNKKASFDEAMLFTHRGLSGPAILQLSSYWSPGEAIRLSLTPQADIEATLKTARNDQPRHSLSSVLEAILPKRLVSRLQQSNTIPAINRVADLSNKAIASIASSLADWQLTPTGTEGWRTAEVTAGGIDTKCLSSRTMESNKTPGLYFIGECVDVTGWLGGYNFQWAWASAAAASDAINGTVYV